MIVVIIPFTSIYRVLLLSCFDITKTAYVKSFVLLKLISNIKSICLDNPFGNMYTAGTLFLKYFPLPSWKNRPRKYLCAFYTAFGIRAVIPGSYLNAS